MSSEQPQTDHNDDGCGCYVAVLIIITLLITFAILYYADSILGR